MTRGTASGNRSIKMEVLFKAFGAVISSTALVSKNGKMVPGSREISAKERNSASAFTCGAMVRHTRAVGKMVKLQGSDVISG